MLIAIATTSILGITLLVYLANRILPFRICPICAGVSGTWIGLIIARFSGYPIDITIPALLMGGSVVGIAYQLEKKLPAEKSSLLWKTFFIPAGFIAAYGILIEWRGIFFAALIFLLLLSSLFLSPRKQQESQKKAVEELKKKMKDCC